RWTVTHGMANGVRIAPMLLPELNKPVAKARSFLGNHSLTPLIDAGKLPPSESPSANRAAQNPTTDDGMIVSHRFSFAGAGTNHTSACAIAARLQKNTARL